MVSLYSGTPGSGKSLHLAERIEFYYQYTNHVIISNFEINREKLKHKRNSAYFYCDNSRLTPDRIIRFTQKYSKRFLGRRPNEGHFILIIDECQLLFNSRDWQIKGRNEWLAFFTQHRKLGIDILLVAQFDRMIDRQIRSLIEYEYVHRKVNNYGKFGAVLGLMCGGALFTYIQYWYPLKQRLNAEFFIGRKKYYQLYNTYNLFDSQAS